jgi:L-ascorbate metabolism protein UlaG (beta-lactamase superfamily)
MKLTKREHACQVIEKTDGTLIIDPGSFTLPLDDITGVVAIVITHEHADHWSTEHLERIRQKNPDARILGPAGVAAAATDHPIEVVAPGDTVEVGPFTLRFFGGKHALIHQSIPIVDNVGVLVDDQLYYAGDSYAIPEGVTVEVLAAPLGAPWLKVGEAMDYVVAIGARRVYPVHDMTLSTIGKNMSHTRLEWAAAQGGGEYSPLEPGDSLDL